MEPLTEIVSREVEAYAGTMLNGISYFTVAPDKSVFAIVDVSRQRDKRFADASLIVRLWHDYIVIERDMNSKILADALEQAGIPREKIILAYAGEPVPDELPELR